MVKSQLLSRIRMWLLLWILFAVCGESFAISDGKFTMNASIATGTADTIY